jgi:hypothetical protein
MQLRWQLLLRCTPAAFACNQLLLSSLRLLRELTLAACCSCVLAV